MLREYADQLLLKKDLNKYVNNSKDSGFDNILEDKETLEQNTFFKRLKTSEKERKEVLGPIQSKKIQREIIEQKFRLGKQKVAKIGLRRSRQFQRASIRVYLLKNRRLERQAISKQRSPGGQKVREVYPNTVARFIKAGILEKVEEDREVYITSYITSERYS